MNTKPMKKVLPIALSMAVLAGCSTYEIAERPTYRFYDGNSMVSIEDIKKRQAERDAKRAYCDSLSNSPKSVNIERAKKLVRNEPWKDPFSLKITEMKGASPQMICHWKNGYRYTNKTPEAVGKVYAKNGYGAYSGATKVVVFTDGVVWTEEK